MDGPPWDQRIARVLVKPLVRSPVTPNQVTAATLLIGLVGAGLFVPGEADLADWGAGLFVLSRFLDHFDGELARQKAMTSRLGYYLDYISGGMSYAALFICLGLGSASTPLGAWAYGLGAAGAVAAVASMFLNLEIDKQGDGEAVGYPGIAGFELEDGIYLLAPITWAGFLKPFFVAAGTGAVIYCLWTLVTLLRKIRPAMRRSLFRLAAVLGLVLGLTGFVSIEALFAPAAVLLERWTAHDPGAKGDIDHGTWDHFLAAYVTKDTDGVNRVAYGRVSAADRQALDGYISGLAAVPISRHTRPRQLAYWINLYNALTVKLIIDHYPVRSIRDISSGFFSLGPWDEDLVQVEGEDLSLNDIEHGILRPIWRDARIHYAVNCAAIGCPNLLSSSYRAETTDDLLDQAARAYINHSRGVRFDGDGLIVSSIYVWFQEDFGDTDKGVIAHLKRFADPELSAELVKADEISDHAYDWGLNGGP